ncbi:MAG: phenylalanine--tRNA ligase beta subunit-related protein [Thermoproteus sp.]
MEIKNLVSEVGVRIAYQTVTGLNNSIRPKELDNIIKSIENEVRNKYNINELKDNKTIRIYRDFYWRVIGIDPTKQRPAQEALLRRVLRGEELPRINPAVDIGNAASIKWLVPVGLYDIDKIGGDILELRWSKGETFYPIGGKPTTVNGQIILAKGETVLHVYPYRDSELTKVDESTKNILIVIAGLKGIDDNILIECSKFISMNYEKLLGGKSSDIKLA